MNHYLKRAMALCLALVLVLSTASVSALAKKTETGSAPETATTAQSKNEQDLKTILKQGIYVKHKKHAGLQQNIRLTPNFALGTATLYLPGQADESRLTLSWADKGVTFQRGKETYSSGEAPVAPSGSSLRYQIRKGPLTAVLTIKTVKGSEGVKPMFLTIDESKGSILAMKYDHDHEKSCYGKVQIQEEEKDMSVRGRGNSTWLFRKKPYNITIYGDDSYQTKKKGELIDGVKSKKWTLLANYFDNSLMRNKIGQDLAEALGIEDRVRRRLDERRISRKLLPLPEEGREHPGRRLCARERPHPGLQKSGSVQVPGDAQYARQAQRGQHQGHRQRRQSGRRDQ